MELQALAHTHMLTQTIYYVSMHIHMHTHTPLYTHASRVQIHTHAGTPIRTHACRGGSKGGSKGSIDPPFRTISGKSKE